MTNRDEELAEILEKINDIRKTAPLTSDDIDSIAMLIKEELDRKKDRQTGPAKGQEYWFARANYTKSYTYDSDDFDLDICKYTSIYPEERFAEAELKAKELIQSVNKRRRELNEGKEFGDRKCYIVFWNVFREAYELDTREESSPMYAQWKSYPFGLFKNSVDCETCIHEFKDELEWFYKDYLPLMAELDDYDWADAPGWGG